MGGASGASLPKVTDKIIYNQRIFSLYKEQSYKEYQQELSRTARDK